MLRCRPVPKRTNIGVSSSHEVRPRSIQGPSPGEHARRTVSSQVTVRPPRRCQPPSRRNACNELRTTAAFRITISGTQLRHLGATAISDLHPSDARLDTRGYAYTVHLRWWKFSSPVRDGDTITVRGSRRDLPGPPTTSRVTAPEQP